MKKLLSLALALILSIGLATPAGAFFDMGKVGIHNTVSAGYSYTAAIDRSGTLMINKSGWPNINFSKKIVSISNGQTEGAIIADDNSLWMWGENSYGQVGNGSNLSVQGTPVKVLDNVAAVSCGGYHAAAIKNRRYTMDVGSQLPWATGNWNSDRFQCACKGDGQCFSCQLRW